METLKSVSYSLEKAESLDDCYSVFSMCDRVQNYQRGELAAVINGNDSKGYVVALASDISAFSTVKTLDEAFSTAIIASQLGGVENAKKST